MAEKPTVLVTGVSGFVAGHCALALLNSGRYRVRGTVRSAANEGAVAHLRAHPVLRAVEVVECPDLLEDGGWAAACAGCAYVLHCASPFPIGKVADGSLVKPAVQGTDRVLRFAAAAGVRRVVVTSSVVAISSGRAKGDVAERVFTEADRSDVAECDEYPKSKTLAEARAWELAEELGLEVATVNPSYVIGPLLSARDCSSVVLVKRLLTGDMPAVPKLWISSVDVRDVADAHVAAMEAPGAAGQRYLVDSGEPRWMTAIADLLRAAYGPRGFKVPSMKAPWCLVALVSLWDKDAAAIRSSLGVKATSYDPAKARALLGRDFRGPEDSYAAMADSLIALGVVKAAK